MARISDTRAANTFCSSRGGSGRFKAESSEALNFRLICIRALRVKYPVARRRLMRAQRKYGFAWSKSARILSRKETCKTSPSTCSSQMAILPTCSSLPFRQLKSKSKRWSRAFALSAGSTIEYFSTLVSIEPCSRTLEMVRIRVPFSGFVVAVRQPVGDFGKLAQGLE